MKNLVDQPLSPASQIELDMNNVAQLKDASEADLNRDAELYELAPVAYFSIERNGQISRANAAAANLLKTAKSKLLGKKFEQFISWNGHFETRFGQFHQYHFGKINRQNRSGSSSRIDA